MLIEKSKKLFWAEGEERTAGAWKSEKKRFILRKRRGREYMDVQREHVRNFATFEKPDDQFEVGNELIAWKI